MPLSHFSSVIKITGFAFGWIDAMTQLRHYVRASLIRFRHGLPSR